MTKNKRRILVTGASKGIGKATAITLAKDGFQIVAHYKNDENGVLDTLNKIEQKTDKESSILQFDISNQKECNDVLTSHIEKFGPFYGVINNAGICKDVPFPAMSINDWHSVIHTDLDSFYNVLKPCIMPMVQARIGGRIVNLTSLSGIIGNRGQVNYSAAKAGIIGASKALALELAKRNITVNCVAAGLIETNMTANLAIPLDRIKKEIPMKRFGKSEEVASLISYLVSDSASYITRQVISINGGLI